MKECDLFSHYPRLWHMAEDGSFDSVLKHGLLSTSALLDLYGMKGEERRKLERMRRPELVRSRKGPAVGYYPRQQTDDRERIREVPHSWPEA